MKRMKTKTRFDCKGCSDIFVCNQESNRTSYHYDLLTSTFNLCNSWKLNEAYTAKLAQVSFTYLQFANTKYLKCHALGV